MADSESGEAGSVNCFGRSWPSSALAVASSPGMMTARFIFHVSYWVLSVIFGALLVGQGSQAAGVDMSRYNTACVALGLAAAGILAIVLDIVGISCGLCGATTSGSGVPEAHKTITKEIAHYLGWASFILYVAIFSAHLTHTHPTKALKDEMNWSILAMTFQGLAITTFVWNASSVSMYMVSGAHSAMEKLLPTK